MIRRIQGAGASYEYIIIEGSGGLLVPLGAGFNVRDLIQGLGCEVILVSQNRLGTINHTLLTLEGLNSRRLRTGQNRPDAARKSRFFSPIQP